MKMYFRYRSLPELAGLSKREKDALWKQARRDPLRFQDAGFLLILFGIMALMVLSSEYLPKSPAWEYFLLSLVCWIGGFQLVDAVMILRYRPMLRRLIGHDSLEAIKRDD